MANSIVIEITANFKDNATAQAKALNAELDKLEKRNINISVNGIDRASQSATNIESRLSKIDGSTATQEVERVIERANSAADKVSTVDVSADTSKFDAAIDGVQNKIDGLEHSEVKVSAGVDNSKWVNGVNIKTLNDSINEQSEQAAEDISERVVYASSKNFGYNQEAIDFVDDYTDELADLQAKADEWGIKYNKTADLNTMRNLVWDYEDKNFYGSSDATENIDKATKILDQATGNEYASDMFNSVKKFGKTMATRMIGATAVVSGVTDAFGDITDAYSSDNSNDSRRSLYRGLTKGGLMGAGALIGSVIPGVGTLFGAGAGALLGEIFGDDLADSISGITKSAEELRQERLDEIFGDISMSAEDLSKVAKNMAGTTWSAQVSQAHQLALSAGYSLQDNTNSSYLDAVESGSKLDIKGNLGFYIPDDDFSSYKTQVNDYMDSIEETMSQEMYNAFMVNDDLFGYDQWDTTGLSDKWKTAFEAFYKQKKELSEYLELALSDDNFSADEREYVFGKIHGMQQTTTELSPDEGQVKNGSFNFMAQNGLLSEDSYDTVIQDVWNGLSTTIQSASEERQKAILENPNAEGDADYAFWEKTGQGAASALNASNTGFNSLYGDDLNTARGQYWSELQKQLNYTNDVNTLFASGAFSSVTGGYSGLGEKIADQTWIEEHFGFREIENDGAREAIKEAYGKELPGIELAEKAALEGRALGVDTSELTSNLMKKYEQGAVGGDYDAMQKFMAGVFAGDAEYNEAISKAMQTNPEQFSEAFREGWKLFNGSDKTLTSDIQNQAEEAQKALDEYADNTAEKAQDAGSKIAEGMEAGNESANQAAEDGAEKFTDSMNEVWDKAEETAKDSEISSDIGENVLNAVNESLANIDGSQLQDIKLGETLMNSISESLSADNMDFKELGFGENLMNAISESLSTDNMDFKELGFGENLMSAIQESLSVDNIDYSQINIGESIMNGISASLENIDVGTIDIAAKVMESINSSLQASDMQIITNLSLTPGNIDTAPIMSAVTAALAEVSSNSVAVSAVISGTANYTLGVYPTMVPDVGGIANYDLGTAPTEAPDISGTSYYSGVFPTSAPTLYGSVVYNAVYSGGTPSMSITGHAIGGVVSGRQLSWVGEEGPEAIIPLVPGRRARGLELWLQTGRALGVMENASGGIVGGEPSYGNNPLLFDNEDTFNENSAVTIAGTSSMGSVSVDVGGITVSIHIDGKSNGNIIEEIKAHSTEIAEVITDELERHIAAAFANS